MCVGPGSFGCVGVASATDVAGLVGLASLAGVVCCSGGRVGCCSGGCSVFSWRVWWVLQWRV